MAELQKQSYKQSYTDNVELSIFNCGHEFCRPGHTWGPGVRDHYLIHLVVAGRGVYQVGGAAFSLQEGDLFLAKPNQLITYAASKCSLLHIFVVEENRSMFPFADRFRLVREGTDHIPNVLVHPSGPYMISNATFPTYFLKKGEDAARIQSELDITLFASRIAPLLHITKRFAGEEPFDPVTRSYNEAMVRLLPQYGISFIRIARFTTGGPQDEIISASRVRKLLMEEGVTEKLLSFVPPCTAEYLKKNQALWKKTAEQEAIRGGDGHEAI